MDEKDWRAKCLATRRFRQVQVKASGKSGLSQNEYCRRNQLCNTQFTYWKKKFVKDTASSINFVPIPVAVAEKAKQGGDSGLTICLGNIRIKLDSDFNSSILTKVMAILARV